jgi:hypothetical protein
MLRAMLRLVLVLVILNPCVQNALSSGQQVPAEVPTVTFRTNARLVMVDVVVTDKKGQPVTGLKSDDFTVEENGKKQKISFAVPPGSARAVAPTPAPAGILSNHPENVAPVGIPTVLLLDAVNSPFKEQAYARSQMLKYAAEQVQSGHSVAVLALTDRLHCSRGQGLLHPQFRQTCPVLALSGYSCFSRSTRLPALWAFRSGTT